MWKGLRWSHVEELKVFSHGRKDLRWSHVEGLEVVSCRRIQWGRLLAPRSKIDKLVQPPLASPLLCTQSMVDAALSW